MIGKRWSGLSVAVVALGMTAACSSGGAEGADTSTTSTGAGSTTTKQAPSFPGPSAAATLTTSCEKIIGHDGPGRDGLRVSDSVVIHRLSPSAPLGDSEEEGLRYFAKVPVSVRSDAEVAISVPEDSRGALAISWASSPNPPGEEVIFDPCGEGGAHEWTTYPGGFYFDEKQCATIVITVDGSSTRQRVPLGAGCA